MSDQPSPGSPVQDVIKKLQHGRTEAEPRLAQIKAALHEEWRLKTGYGIHHDHLSDLAFLIAHAEWLSDVADRLAALSHHHPPVQEVIAEAVNRHGETFVGLWLQVLDHPPTDQCPDMECMVCSVRDCPSWEPLHYHHDGCPCCTQSKDAR